MLHARVPPHPQQQVVVSWDYHKQRTSIFPCLSSKPAKNTGDLKQLWSDRLSVAASRIKICFISASVIGFVPAVVNVGGYVALLLGSLFTFFVLLSAEISGHVVRIHNARPKQQLSVAVGSFASRQLWESSIFWWQH